MIFMKSLSQAFGYVVEAALEVFSPDHDSYPYTGVQPFEGEISRKLPRGLFSKG
jgi:hypothetical protein